MGGSIHCCTKDKDNDNEVISTKEEESVKAFYSNKYKNDVKKIIKIQNIYRAFRIRREIKENFKQEKSKILNYLEKNNFYIHDLNDFNSLMHPLVKRSLNYFQKLKGQFGIRELENILKPLSFDFHDGNTRPIWINKEKRTAYKGQFNNHLKPHGTGVLIKSDGSRYEGFFSNGKLHGYGRYFTIKGEYFEGDFKHGVASGNGVFIHPDGNTYIGQWHNDKTDGQGYEIFTDGSKFEGNFRSGKKNGKGIYNWIDGSNYDGYFKDDLLNGYGYYKWPDNSSYEGEWKDNLMNGKGIFTFADGSKYEGDFVNNKRSGQGKYIWSENKFHIGGWKDGKQHGKGRYYKNDKVIEGIWNDGKLINN